jgi:hypothetical protein
MDDKRIVSAIEKLVLGMCGVIDEMPPEMRKRVLTSILAVSNDIADRLEGSYQDGTSTALSRAAFKAPTVL